MTLLLFVTIVVGVIFIGSLVYTFLPHLLFLWRLHRVKGIIKKYEQQEESIDAEQ